MQFDALFFVFHFANNFFYNTFSRKKDKTTWFKITFFAVKINIEN